MFFVCYNKVMVKRGLVLGGALALFSGFFVSNVFADENLDLSVTIEQASLQLTVPATANLDLTPTSAAADFKSTNLTIKVGTNNVTGYTLTMSVPSTDISRIGAASGDPVIGTLGDQSGGYSENDFTANKWGYKITGNNYFPVTTTLSPNEWITDGPANNVDNTITLASKVNTAIPSGTYKTTLTFEAVANQVPPVSLEMAYRAYGKQKVTVGNDEYYKMQDMTSDICNLTAEIPSELQVVDIRDEKIYWIAKLADGHCWMTQNLDLDLETTPTHVLALTSENTDLNTYGSNGYDSSNGYSKDANDVITWTPERNTIPTSSISSAGSITGWTNDYNNPYSIDTGDWYWIGNWKNNGIDTWYESDTNNYLDGDNSGAGDKFSITPYTGNGKHGHVGNYYNWSAAIASNNSTSYNASTLADITANPQNSICPSGWRLPTVSNASDMDGSTNEFGRLVSMHGNFIGSDRTLTASPLWFIRGGAVGGRSLGYSGKDGYYWSSTVYGGGYAYSLSFYSSNIYVAYNRNGDAGRSVRCVAR